MHSRIARAIALRAVGALYKRKFRWIKRCIYCGDTAMQLDHVLPVSVAAALPVEWHRPGVKSEFKQGFSMVPCCAECNRLAASTPFVSIRTKRRYVQEKLKRKYRKLITGELWSSEELRELGPTLRSHVKTREHEKRFVELRIAWPVRWSI